MRSNDLTFIVMLEAGLILYILHKFALGSVQLRMFFSLQSMCVLVSVCPLWSNLAIGPLHSPRLTAENLWRHLTTVPVKMSVFLQS